MKLVLFLVFALQVSIANANSAVDDCEAYGEIQNESISLMIDSPNITLKEYGVSSAGKLIKKKFPDKAVKITADLYLVNKTLMKSYNKIYSHYVEKNDETTAKNKAKSDILSITEDAKAKCVSNSFVKKK